MSLIFALMSKLFYLQLNKGFSNHKEYEVFNSLARVFLCGVFVRYARLHNGRTAQTAFGNV